MSGPPNDGHARGYAKSEMITVYSSLQDALQGASLAQRISNGSGTTIVPDRDFSPGLVPYLSGSADVLLRRYYQSGSIADRFGRPYRLFVTTDTIAQQEAGLQPLLIKIWSAGKNGKDECGLGDDEVFGPTPLLVPKLNWARSVRHP